MTIVDSDVLLILVPLLCLLAGLAGIWVFGRSGHLTLLRRGDRVEAELRTNLLGILTIRTVKLRNVERAEVQHAPRRAGKGRSSRVVLWVGEEMVPFQEVFTNTNPWKERSAARINRFIQEGRGEDMTALTANVIGAWFFSLMLFFPLVLFGGYGLYAITKEAVFHGSGPAALRGTEHAMVFEGGRWKAVPRSTAVPAEFPEGAYYPEFCSFSNVELRSRDFRVFGSTAMTIAAAGKYVVTKMKNSGWQPYDRIMQPDAESYSYERAGVQLTYTFYLSPIDPSKGINCWLTWRSR